MKILFFVPALVDAVDIHHELTTRLAHCLSDSEEIRIVTSAERNIASLLSDYDILHIFGCWSNSACLLAEKAYRLRIPYVITPLGALQPWEIEHHKHRPFNFRRQKAVVERAAAINVCGKLEEKTFEQLAFNKRVCLIKNPILTSQTTFDEVAACFKNLYQKVIDSNVRLLLSEQVQKVIFMLLQFSVDLQSFNYRSNENALRCELDKLSPNDWRKIFIYAEDENVSEIIREALDKLDYQYPQTDVSKIDRFDAQTGYIAGQLRNDTLLSRNLLLRNKVKEVFATRGKTEQGVCLQMLNLRYEISRNIVPLRHFVDLYATMRFTDMDEDMIKDMTKELDMEDFAQSLTAVMADLLGLTEGFMAVNPANGKRAKQLSTSITKFGLYK